MQPKLTIVVAILALTIEIHGGGAQQVHSGVEFNSQQFLVDKILEEISRTIARTCVEIERNSSNIHGKANKTLESMIKGMKHQTDKLGQFIKNAENPKQTETETMKKLTSLTENKIEVLEGSGRDIEARGWFGKSKQGSDKNKTTKPKNKSKAGDWAKEVLKEVATGITTAVIVDKITGNGQVNEES